MVEVKENVKGSEKIQEILKILFSQYYSNSFGSPGDTKDPEELE